MNNVKLPDKIKTLTDQGMSLNMLKEQLQQLQQAAPVPENVHMPLSEKVQLSAITVTISVLIMSILIALVQYGDHLILRKIIRRTHDYVNKYVGQTPKADDYVRNNRKGHTTHSKVMFGQEMQSLSNNGRDDDPQDSIEYIEVETVETSLENNITVPKRSIKQSEDVFPMVELP